MTAEEAHTRFVITQICHPLTSQITDAFTHSALKKHHFVQTGLDLQFVFCALYWYILLHNVTYTLLKWNRPTTLPKHTQLNSTPLHSKHLHCADTVQCSYSTPHPNQVFYLEWCQRWIHSQINADRCKVLAFEHNSLLQFCLKKTELHSPHSVQKRHKTHFIWS